MHNSFCCYGKLYPLDKVYIMGILNITPDSFYASSRVNSEEEILSRCQQLLEEGADILDIGACSTRPGAQLPDREEESRRLFYALHVIRKEYPDAMISVDTFHSEIARRAVEEFGVSIINDISGGRFDPEMFETVGKLQIPYVLMHMQGTPETMQNQPVYKSPVEEISQWFVQKTLELREAGVADIILDPGFGFGKTTEQNYEILSRLNDFAIHDLPLLVGVSRKGMIQRLLGVSSEESLNGTTAVHVVALMKGVVRFLRVHDVKSAVECVKVYEMVRKGENSDFFF